MNQQATTSRTEKGFDHISPAHRIPRERTPIWDIETVADICKGVLALVLVGIGAGLVMAAGRILWEVADQYAYAIALWISGAL